MTLTRFHHLAEVHGADLDRWPAEHRGAARELLARSGEARRMLDAAAALDRILARTAAGPSDARLEAMLEAIDARIDADCAASPTRPPVRPVRHLWPTVAFLAAMAMLGFLTGDPNLLQLHKARTMQIADTMTPSYIVAWEK